MVSECFYLLIIFWEILNSWVCRLPFAVNMTLNFSNVFSFSWDDFNTQEKLKTKVMQTRCIVGYVQMANGPTSKHMSKRDI